MPQMPKSILWKCATDIRKSQQSGSQPQLLFLTWLTVAKSHCMTNLVTLTLSLGVVNEL